tara:strand:- start:29840 stop:29998 length:159 start_codon:yes stop_codon:yes gene_type:complete
MVIFQVFNHVLAFSQDRIKLIGFGAIAQLGERNTGSVEVRGSIPLGSTTFAK